MNGSLPVYPVGARITLWTSDLVNLGGFVVPWESAERIARESVVHEGGGAWATVQYPSGHVVKIGPWKLVTRPAIMAPPQGPDAAPFPGRDRASATAVPGGEWALFPPEGAEDARQWGRKIGAQAIVWRNYQWRTAELLRC